MAKKHERGFCAAAIPGKIPRKPGILELADIELARSSDEQILVETIYGSWEGNMSHAILRDPIDVCRRLGQEWIVLGNSGVVRVLSSRTEPGYPPEGTICAFAPIGKQDPYGYVRTVCAYDEPGTMGTLAERFYVNASQLVPLPDEKVVPLVRWASFPVRYTSAWSNWRVALGAWRLQMPSVPTEQTHVWAWGGGVAFAELELARSIGCKTVMFHSGKERGTIIRAAGITPVDREQFAALTTAIPANRKGLADYFKSERTFLNLVDELTNGRRVSIFIDNIGGPVVRQLCGRWDGKALSRAVDGSAASHSNTTERSSVLNAIYSCTHTQVHCKRGLMRCNTLLKRGGSRHSRKRFMLGTKSQRWSRRTMLDTLLNISPPLQPPQRPIYSVVQ